MLFRSYRGPLIAFGVALLLALAARMWRSTTLAGAAGGLGVAAGWFALGSTTVSWLLRFPVDSASRPPAERLWVLAAAALAGGVVLARLSPKRLLWPLVVGIGLLCAWWIVGLPLTRTALIAEAPLGLGLAAGILLVVFLTSAPTAEPGRIVAAAATLAIAFHQVDAARIWVLLALVPMAAALPLRIVPVQAWPMLLPVALDVAGLSAIAVAVAGRLPKLGIRGIDVAALSPLLTLWLMPLIEARLSGTGRAARIFAAIIACGITAAAIWIWLRVRG